VPRINQTSALRSRSASSFPYVGVADLLDKALLGGDTRLAIDSVTGLNNYSCSPRPRADVLEFSSSTASTISDYSYERAASSYRRLLNDSSIRNFDELVEGARGEHRQHIGLDDEDADIVFAPSGTDAQLIALFPVRATLGTPLERTAVLRASSSARFVIRCWSSNPILANSGIQHEIGQIGHLTEQLSALIGGKSVPRPLAMTR
jgi:hypothetical protein